jgi:predicted sugar kinase
MLAAESEDPAPIVSLAGDAGRYYTMVGEALSESGAELSDETADSIRESMEALAKVYDRMRLDVHFTERGVELDVGMTFKD